MFNRAEIKTRWAAFLETDIGQQVQGERDLSQMAKFNLWLLQEGYPRVRLPKFREVIVGQDATGRPS